MRVVEQVADRVALRCDHALAAGLVAQGGWNTDVRHAGSGTTAQNST